MNIFYTRRLIVFVLVILMQAGFGASLKRACRLAGHSLQDLPRSPLWISSGLKESAPFCTATLTLARTRRGYSSQSFLLMSSKDDGDKKMTRASVVGGSANPGTVTVTAGEDDGSGGVKGGVKLLWKRYGMVAIGTYLGIYLSVLSSLFFSLDYDIFRSSTFGLDPAAAVQKVCDLVEQWTGNTSLPGFFRDHPRAGTFAVAWVMCKFTEPLRALVTVAIVPSVSRALGYAPPKDKKE